LYIFFRKNALRGAFKALKPIQILKKTFFERFLLIFSGSTLNFPGTNFILNFEKNQVNNLLVSFHGFLTSSLKLF
jgi:hypothetical protein